MDTQISFSFITPQEAALKIATKAKAKRLSLNFTQQTLATRSGVSFGVIKKFERTGAISLNSLLRIALVLNALEDFSALFKAKAPEEYPSLNTLIRVQIRKRARL